MQPGYRHRAPAASPGPAERIGRLSPARVLERISRARPQREELDAELALLVDRAVAAGIGWPEIAARLGGAGRRPASTTSAVTVAAAAQPDRQRA